MNLPLALDSVPSEGTGYVFAAYLFFMLVILVYIAILGMKFVRINKELGQLNEELEANSSTGTGTPVAAETPAGSPAEPAEATNG